MAISALNKDGGLELEEIQLSLARAVKSSPKSSVIAHYPKENYDIADLRLDIVANLASIRRNPDAPRAIKFVIDVKMEDGSYFLENNPEKFKIEMSYNKFSNLSDITYARDVIIPLVDKLKAYENENGSVDEPDPFNAFDGKPEPAKQSKPKNPPSTLKCEVILESLDESFDDELVTEPTRQKMRSMFLKATTNKNKYKFLIKSTLENKKYDYVEVNYNEDGLIVSLIKDEIVEQSKSVNSTVAYRVVNEYIKCEDINIDSIEQDVLSQPPKPKPVQQNNNSSGAGCLTAVIPIVCFLIYIILKFFD